MPKPLNISQEQFDSVLEDILLEMRASELLSVPGFYEVVSEHFNNEVIKRIRDIRDEAAEEELHPSG